MILHPGGHRSFDHFAFAHSLLLLVFKFLLVNWLKNVILLHYNMLFLLVRIVLPSAVFEFCIRRIRSRTRSYRFVFRFSLFFLSILFYSYFAFFSFLILYFYLLFSLFRLPACLCINPSSLSYTVFFSLISFSFLLYDSCLFLPLLCHFFLFFFVSICLKCLCILAEACLPRSQKGLTRLTFPNQIRNWPLSFFFVNYFWFCFFSAL